MSADDLDALIVRNLRDLDAAAKRLRFDIQPRIAKTINTVAANWARENKWIGEYDWWEEDHGEGELWIAPPHWKKENDQLAFYLACGPGDEDGVNASEDFFWLTRLCNAGTGLVCIRWHSFQRLNAKKPDWKKFVRSYVAKIKGVGFSYEDETALFASAPIIISSDQLAKAIIDDTLEQAFEPLRTALDSLIRAEPVFDEMIREARSEFGPAVA